MRTIIRVSAIVALILTLSPVATAAAAETVDLTPNFRSAGASLESLQVYELAGIVVIRGRAANQAQAEELGRIAHNLGYSRVANLIQITENRDAEILRRAEMELSVNRSLDGCKFHVTSQQGVVKVAGVVRHELQKDVAAQVLRNINGIRSVEFDLTRF